MASLLKAVQSKKALLPMYFSEGDGKLNKGCTVHEGFNSNCMESRRKENFSKASAVHKGEFRNFFNHGVTKVYTS